MKNSTIALILCLLCSQITFGQGEPFTMRVINTGYNLNSAWEVTYGPDDSLWVTENKAYIISRIDPVSGTKTQLINLSSKKNFSNPPKWPQGGLMGLALHPSMYSEWPTPSKPYVYVAYVYQYSTSSGNACNSTQPCTFKTRIARYNYDRNTHSLSNETILIESLNGSNDHNSGRLAIGKVNGTDYLFYSIGDMGAGQFNNINRTNNAQSTTVPEGKILRFNLEEDGDANQWDKWIPNDNPFSSGGKKNPIWSYGHRNPQGIVFSKDGILYSSEQQDRTDDEVNIIEEGRNYGWPKVSGFCDGNYTGLKLANQNVGDEVDNCTTLNAKEPIYTLFTNSDPGSLPNDYLTWPTVAASGIDIYEKNVIPGWSKSLLVPSLKAGLIFKLKLSEDGQSVTDMATIPVTEYQGRFRDLAISPDGLKIYAAADMGGTAKRPDGTYGAPLNQGKILEFTYTGTTMAIRDDTYRYNRNTDFQLYPNPATTQIHIKSIKNTNKPLFYYIYETSGKLVLNGKSFTDFFDINVSHLSRGMYIIKIYNGYNRNIYTEKVTIQ
ncbi:MAG: PQQ-dependent sugar dehydrogenase [Chitinophagaceae bacterium]|nr:PQQ-dependent sugar dehydrogenase [Chitinophagaceae bacterium]MCW5914957.1 PQQ-dependent sugar dehydrogenase [Chitinophagaceae bacterium]MCZ2396774.1 PQQ-dependent sugar dehydrogenase [Chitinophagales bacterium]